MSKMFRLWRLMEIVSNLVAKTCVWIQIILRHPVMATQRLIVIVTFRGNQEVVKVIVAYLMNAGVLLADETEHTGVIAAVRRVLGLNQRNSTDMGVLKHSWHSLKIAVLMWRPAGYWILDIHVLTDVQTG